MRTFDIALTQEAGVVDDPSAATDRVDVNSASHAATVNQHVADGEIAVDKVAAG